MTIQPKENNNNILDLGDKNTRSSIESVDEKFSVATDILKNSSDLLFNPVETAKLGKSNKIIYQESLAREKYSLEDTLDVLINNSNCEQIKSELKNCTSEKFEEPFPVYTESYLDDLKNQILNALLKLQVSSIDKVLISIDSPYTLRIVEVAKCLIILNSNKNIKSPFKFCRHLVDLGFINYFGEVIKKKDRIGKDLNDSKAYLYLAKHYAIKGKVKDALEAFDHTGKSRSSKEFLHILITLSENGYLKEACELLISEVNDQILLDSFFRYRQPPVADCPNDLLAQVLKKIDGDEVTKDPEYCDYIIGDVALRVIIEELIASEAIEKAVSLVKDYGFDQEPYRGIKAIFKELRWRGDIKRILSLKELIKNGDIDQDYYYLCLSEAYSKNNNFDKSLEIIENRIGNQLLEERATQTLINHLFKESMNNKALELFSKLNHSDLWPTFDELKNFCFAAIALAKMGKFEEMKTYLKKVRGSRNGIFEYTELVFDISDVLFKMKEYEQLKEVLLSVDFNSISWVKVKQYLQYFQEVVSFEDLESFIQSNRIGQYELRGICENLAKKGEYINAIRLVDWGGGTTARYNIISAILIQMAINGESEGMLLTFTDQFLPHVEKNKVFLFIVSELKIKGYECEAEKFIGCIKFETSKKLYFIENAIHHLMEIKKNKTDDEFIASVQKCGIPTVFQDQLFLNVAAEKINKDDYENFVKFLSLAQSSYLRDKCITEHYSNIIDIIDAGKYKTAINYLNHLTCNKNYNKLINRIAKNSDSANHLPETFEAVLCLQRIETTSDEDLFENEKSIFFSVQEQLSSQIYDFNPYYW